MRKLTLLLLVVAASAFASPSKQTLGARSAAHELRLERSVVAADRIAYNVVVVDTASGATVLSSNTEGKPGEAVEVVSLSGAQQIRVRLAYSQHFFSATVNVTEGASIVDEFRTWWQLEPRTAGAITPPATPQMINGVAPLRVGGDVKAPIIINRVEPIYTEEALAAHVSGIVIVEAIIGKDGLVKNVQVLKPLPFGLDQAAVDAVKQWTFKPGTLNGEPVDVIFNLTVNFKVASPPPPPPQQELLNAPDAYHVGGDVKAPVVVHGVSPLYPEEARRNNVTGIVILEVLIGKDGKVKDAAVRKGLPYGLSESALDCVRQWEFKPATRNGEPVDVIFNLTINFRL